MNDKKVVTVKTYPFRDSDEYGLDEKAIQMNERPISFCEQMVRAIMCGAETQLRRPMKQLPYGGAVLFGPEWYEPTVIRNGEDVPGPPVYGVYDDMGDYGCASPFGGPGDKIWVREEFHTDRANEIINYKVDYNGCDPFNEDEYDQFNEDECGDNCSMAGEVWRPANHMPRWASRITLVVLRVWTERDPTGEMQWACEFEVAK